MSNTSESQLYHHSLIEDIPPSPRLPTTVGQRPHIFSQYIRGMGASRPSSRRDGQDGSKDIQGPAGAAEASEQE